MYIHCSNKPSLRCLLCSGKWAVLEREHLQPLESSKAWLHMVIKISPLKTSEQVNSQDYPFNVGQVWTIWRQRSCYHVLLPPSLGWFPPAPQWMESVHSPLHASPLTDAWGRVRLSCFAVHHVLSWGWFTVAYWLVFHQTCVWERWVFTKKSNIFI